MDTLRFGSQEFEFYVAGTELDVLARKKTADYGHALPQKPKKGAESSLLVLDCALGSDAALPAAAPVTCTPVLLEYHKVDEMQFFIATHAGQPILKCDVTRVREQLEPALRVLAQKGLEAQVRRKNMELKMQKSEQSTRPRKKRRFTPAPAGFTRIQHKYRDLECSDVVLAVADNGTWQLEFQIHLKYRENAANLFAPETNAFLDESFSARDRVHFLKHEITNLNSRLDVSYNVQRKFNHQSAKYTKHLCLGPSPAIQEIPQLNVQLLPFQMESLQWMLDKEGFLKSDADPELKPEYDIEALCEYLNAYVSFGYEIIRIPKRPPVFWNKFTGYIISLQNAQELSKSTEVNERRAKGVLSEEMGLGKTLEVLALILVHKRTIAGTPTYRSDSKKEILKASTNLIVCPDSILSQWIGEIESHVVNEDPDAHSNNGVLRIFHYEGYQEVRKCFSTDDIGTIVQHLSNYDIIICSYSTVSSEVHYAEFSSMARHRRGAAPKYDYTSPLSLLQFFRIILDEVQMLGSESTNAARCTGLLHRVHTWGVSGTPIYDITHFQTVLSYLQFHPFQDSPKIVDAVEIGIYRQNNLLSRYHTQHSDLVNGVKFDIYDLMDLFPRFNLCIRHSKEDVADQILIPKQHNYIVPLEFFPIERDNYMNLWSAFLNASGYQSDGRGGTNMPSAQLNYWLSLLRETCCHALMPNSTQKQEAENELPEVQSIDAILKRITDEVYEKIDTLHRENIGLQIQAAQVDMELKENPMKAVRDLASVREELTKDLSARFRIHVSLFSGDVSNATLKDTSNNDSQKLHAKPYMDLLHQCCFFIATAYYLMGSKKLEAVDEENEKHAQTISADGKCNSSKSVVSRSYTDVYSEDEMKDINTYQTLEQQNYAHAEALRKAILADRIERVDSEISSVQKFFTNKKSSVTCFLKEIPFAWDEDYSSNMHVASCFKRLQTAFQNLNKQSQQFNGLVERLQEHSYRPIIREYTEENEDEKAQDYENSIEDQDKMFAILDCLERILSNREDIITAEEETAESSKAFLKNTETFSPFHITLATELFLPESPTLKPVFTDLKNVNIVKSLVGTLQRDASKFESYLLGFEKEVVKLKKEIKQLREYLKKFNDIYNAKTAYFSNLQRISDSLVSLIQLKPSMQASILKNVKDNTLLSKNVQKINSLQSRLKYLETLTKLKEGLKNENTFNCTICLGEIYMGSVIKCGHFFCQGCIFSWLKNHASCPLCKMQTSMSEVYSFKFQDAHPEADPDQDTDAQKDGDNNKTEATPNNGQSEGEYPLKFRRYPDLEKINQLALKESYGVKIDFAVKLVLYLLYRHKNNNEESGGNASPQIIIYSQYSEFLNLLSKVLKQHSVLHCNTAGAGKFSRMVEKFKKNPDVTCLLLNVTRQATGLTLVNATHVFIMDPIMNTSDEQQAINRTHRIGQTRETHVWNFVVRNTVEQNIVRLKGVLEEREASRKQKRTKNSKDRGFKTKSVIGNGGIVSRDSDDSDEEEDDENLFNVNRGGSVSGKHIWNCFFQD
ncbi:LAQU0S06e04544g1_1 [Lachancea quebecensis]|uniref:LAQU0S06e04544g1_1 n=1 Tax=Lachancea quebecensis TaxID=1654605 RepID=A0A0P1L0W7_9SACH|nr:LAQU0S06e04544g1_1 [Lachancea quebecensis]